MKSDSSAVDSLITPGCDFGGASLITVVLLTFNHEGTIRRAFDSILEQKTKFPYHVLVLEDCSTDYTAEICREYKENYQNLIELSLNQSNVGAFANLQRGLQKVNTKYFAFLEGDDYWCDQLKLEKQVTVLEQNPDCSFCGHNTIYNDEIHNKVKDCVGLDADAKHLGKYDHSVRFKVHPSARIYRNNIDFSTLPELLVEDKNLYFLYLLSGKMIYLEDKMSVFNNTGRGIWSGKNRWQKRLLNLELEDQALTFFEFKHSERYFVGSRILPTLKSLLGFKLGWKLFYWIEKLRCRINLDYESLTGRVLK